ncbi:hypothetical protein NQ317_019219 [Molorchus minor]|uniref:Uncharacterized protein n=1 Tax=Molorchus minor TaxID=1323400 RepID=A0ABQ9JT20_9CUCU|nr:hypothetical protein NQ317_019219 [Molorchus minor]
MCDSDTANRNIDLNMENQNMDTTNSNTITDTDIKNVIRHFSQKTYYASSETAEEKAFLLRCINLMNIDYTVTIINNTNGELSLNILNERAVIQKFNLAKKKGRARRTTSTIYEYDHCDPEKTRDLFLKARLARCRTRFPVPTILYKGKYICRSATLSGGPEMYSRRGIEIITGVDTSSDPIETMEEFSTPTQSEWKLFDEVREMMLPF